MLELGAEGRRIILQVVDLSSAFVRATQDSSLDQKLSRDVELHDGVEGRAPCCEQQLPSASAWGTVRGKPSRRNPPWASAASRRSSTSPMTTSSGTSAPRVMILRRLQAERGPGLLGRAQHVPVEICGIAEALAEDLRLRALARARRARASTSLIAARLRSAFGQAPRADASGAGAGEAFVAARDEVRFDLVDRVERDADDDHERRAAELERHAERSG